MANDDNDPPVQPPVKPPINIQEPPANPTPPPSAAAPNGEVDARIAAIEGSVTAVTEGLGALTEKLDAVLNPQTPPTDPPENDPSKNTEVIKLQGELDVLKTAFQQENATKVAAEVARKTEIIDTIVTNNPVYAAQKESLANMDEQFLTMLADQSKPAEPRARVAGGDKYTTEDYQTQAARLREERRKNRIR